MGLDRMRGAVHHPVNGARTPIGKEPPMTQHDAVNDASYAANASAEPWNEPLPATENAAYDAEPPTPECVANGSHSDDLTHEHELRYHVGRHAHRDDGYDHLRESADARYTSPEPSDSELAAMHDDVLVHDHRFVAGIDGRCVSRTFYMNHASLCALPRERHAA